MSDVFYLKGKLQKKRKAPRHKPRQYPQSKPDEPRVSDHALVRYLDRVLGLPVQDWKASLLTEKAQAAIGAGSCGYTEDGVRYVIENSVIVTVIPVKDEA